MSEQDDYTPSVEWVRIMVGYAKTMAKDSTLPIEGARQEGYAWFDRMIAQVRREAAAEQREKDAQIAESCYFGGGAVGSANRWGAKQAATAIREQGNQ